MRDDCDEHQKSCKKTFTQSSGSHIWAKKHAARVEEVARLVDDTHRKMQMAGATDLESSPQNSTPTKSVEDFDDSPSTEMKIQCLCGSSLPTESMIQLLRAMFLRLHVLHGTTVACLNRK
ncbi:hypothetical protein V2J09_011926 [Rumex salicifolius]